MRHASDVCCRSQTMVRRTRGGTRQLRFCPRSAEEAGRHTACATASWRKIATKWGKTMFWMYQNITAGSILGIKGKQKLDFYQHMGLIGEWWLPLRSLLHFILLIDLAVKPIGFKCHHVTLRTWHCKPWDVRQWQIIATVRLGEGFAKIMRGGGLKRHARRLQVQLKYYREFNPKFQEVKCLA